PISSLIKIQEKFEPEKTIYDNWNWVHTRLLKTMAEKSLFKKIYWSYAISISLSPIIDMQIATKDKEKEVLFKSLKKLPHKLLVSIKNLLPNRNIPESLHKTLDSSLATLLSENQAEIANSEQGKPSLKSLSPFDEQIFLHKPGSEKDTGPSLTSPEHQAEKKRRKAKNIQEEIMANEEPVWVMDAGLVLLSPFLPALFKTCDYLDNGIFRSTEMGASAVNLLVYMAHGLEELPEYQKLLPKFLCGILWETLLPETDPISDLERSNADELLIAVVTHWKALKNSSPEAVQEAFIRRLGKIIAGNPGILLEVEPKTQDILLKRLPWGFSMIKFQWMPDILQVKWI